MATFLRSYLNRRSVRDYLPDFIDLRIRYRDAAVSPILGPMRRTQPAKAVGQPMNHDVPTRGHTA